MRMLFKVLMIVIVGLVISSSAIASQWVKGIYLTQSTVENKRSLSSLIKKSKKYGINTFVIDVNRKSSAYRRNIVLVRENKIKYVARIVVFPHGGTSAQVLSKKYWQKKYKLVEIALQLGAQEIQLDYIRYSSSRRASSQNARNIYEVIKWFKAKLKEKNIPLQVDVFGITGFYDALHIGQNLRLFADSVDAICPMVYPSHYEPYRKHAKTPYATVLSTLQSLHAQFNDNRPFKVYPFIELYNYRYPLSRKAKLNYIYQQIRAVEDNHANGWYAWSPTNKYNNLFRVLQMYNLK
jgi:hypothetical protein